MSPTKFTLEAMTVLISSSKEYNVITFDKTVEHQKYEQKSENLS
jgi:hypothetical protein